MMNGSMSLSLVKNKLLSLALLGGFFIFECEEPALQFGVRSRQVQLFWIACVVLIMVYSCISRIVWEFNWWFWWNSCPLLGTVSIGCFVLCTLSVMGKDFDLWMLVIFGVSSSTMSLEHRTLEISACSFHMDFPSMCWWYCSSSSLDYCWWQLLRLAGLLYDLVYQFLKFLRVPTWNMSKAKKWNLSFSLFEREDGILNMIAVFNGVRVNCSLGWPKHGQLVSDPSNVWPKGLFHWWATDFMLLQYNRLGCGEDTAREDEFLGKVSWQTGQPSVWRLALTPVQRYELKWVPACCSSNMYLNISS